MAEPFSARFGIQKDGKGRPVKGAAKVFLHDCCICGAWGGFGSGVRLSEAIRRDHLSPDDRRKLAGRWYCHRHWQELQQTSTRPAARPAA